MLGIMMALCFIIPLHFLSIVRDHRYDRKVIRFDDLARENPRGMIEEMQSSLESLQKKYRQMDTFEMAPHLLDVEWYLDVLEVARNPEVRKRYTEPCNNAVVRFGRGKG